MSQSMSMDEYQNRAISTAVYPVGRELEYLIPSLMVEAAEVADPYVKAIRANAPVPYEHMLDELGDVLWNVAALAHECGVSLAEVAVHNLNKLQKRREQGTLDTTERHE